MCMYSTLGLNPKYKYNKKNGGIIPPFPNGDERVKYTPFKCNNCMECKKEKAREWQVRLLEEVRDRKDGKFITLTFSNESIKELINQKPTKNWTSLYGLEGYNLDNAIATRAMRLFTERWRKEHTKTIRHFTVTELGHEGTENIHLHGILWTTERYSKIAQHWKYGHIWPTKYEDEKTNYVSERTVNYIIKYITKIDTDHPNYQSIILTSNGIGNTYTQRMDAKYNKYQGQNTNEAYTTKTGHKIKMPIYWRNKIYSEQEREQLWLYKLDKQIRYVGGEKIDISKGDQEYWKAIKYHRERAKKIGYNDGGKNWEKLVYETYQRNIQQMTRLKNAK